MLGEFFKSEFPDKYYNLGIKQYIKSNYNFYNIGRLELCSLSIINNIHYRRNNKKYILISKNPNKYPIQKFSYHEIINSLTILKNLNIIIEETGFRNYKEKNKLGEWYYKDATATKIYLKSYEEWKIDELNLSWFNFCKIIFCNKLPNPHVFNRTKYKKTIINEKINKNFLFNSSLDRINKYLKNNNEINLQYKRVFGETLHEYGRFYNSFQTIPKKLREKVLKEKDWIELDYTSCLINILYIIETGKMYDGDIYFDLLKKLNLSNDYRSLLKELLIIALNTKNKNSAIKAIRKLLIDNGLYNKENWFSSEIILNILNVFESYKYLKKYLYYNSSYFTQNIESNIISKLMLEMIKDNILPISIHDCIIIPSQYENKYKLLMNQLLISECNLYKYSFYYNKIFQYILNINLFNSQKYNKNNNIFYKNIITIRVWENEYG